MSRRLLFVALALILVAAIASLAHLPPAVLTTTRWLALVALIIYAVFRRSLTTWIFIAMIAGAEVGHDLPRYADAL